MNIGLIVYSKSGNTRQIAEKMKINVEEQDHEVELISINPEKQPGFFKAVWSAIRQKTLPITNDSLDVSSYDIVFIGNPVWAGKPAPFIKTMLEKTIGFDGKKTAVFITCGGGEKPGSDVIELMKSYAQKKGADVMDDSLIVHMNRKGEIKKEIPSVESFVSTVAKSK